MNKVIAWEKWRDDEHFQETSADLSQTIHSEIEDDIEEFEDSEDGMKLPNLNVGVTLYPHFVKTPLGEFSVLDNNLPSKMFDCWVGHTNFPITREEFDIIDNESEGVEVFRVMSKYRFFIGVAKLFKFRDVAEQIKSLLCSEDYEDDFEISEEYIKEIILKDKSVKRWAALILDNGSFQYITSKSLDKDDEFDEKLEELYEIEDGLVIEGTIES